MPPPHVSGQGGGRVKGGRSRSHMSVLKKLDSTLTYFLCIRHSLAAGWCAIFTHGSRLESSGDDSAAELGVSRIQNTAMLRINWFFFNASRRVLTLRERPRNSAARMFACTLTFQRALVIPSGTINSSSNWQAAPTKIRIREKQNTEKTPNVCI